MAYLNWTNSGILPKTFSNSPARTELSLTLTNEQIQELVLELEEIFFKRAGELRLLLPNQWLLFWKLREDGNRALLAHPQKDEWVGTFALEGSMASRFLETMKNLLKDQKLVLSQCGVLSSVSNLDLMIHLEG